MASGIILSDDIIAKVGVERTAQQIIADLAELEAFRSLANTYTPNGTTDELQKCLEDCESLDQPDGWGEWDDSDVFDLATNNIYWDDYVRESSCYTDMEEEKDDEIESFKELGDSFLEECERKRNIVEHYRGIMDEIDKLEKPDHFDSTPDDLVDYVKGLKAENEKLEERISNWHDANMERDEALDMVEELKTEIDRLNAEIVYE